MKPVLAEDYVPSTMTPEQTFVQRFCTAHPEYLLDEPKPYARDEGDYFYVHTAHLFQATDGAIQTGRGVVIRCRSSLPDRSFMAESYVRLNEEQFDALAQVMGYERKQ